MTYEEKIQWLGQYRAAVRRERLLEGELEMLRSAAARVTACLSGMPGAGSDVDRLPKAIEKIEESEKSLERQIEECVACRGAVLQVITRVPRADVQEVLRRRYILGQNYEEIADAVGVVLRRVYQIHRAGVMALPLEEETGGGEAS